MTPDWPFTARTSGQGANDQYAHKMHASNGSSGPVSIRLAGLEDVSAVAHVHRESRSWYYEISPDPSDGRETFWQAMLSDPQQTTYVAQEQGGALVGFVSSKQPDRNSGPVKLDSLYVLPSYFAQGIGSALYWKFDACERRGGPALLEVWSANSRAIEFYVRRGWVATSTERPGPKEQPFVTYRLGAT